MKLKKLKINRKLILQIMVFLMIFVSQETVLFGILDNPLLVSIAQYSNFLIVILAFAIRKRKTFNRKDTIILAITVAALWGSFIFNVGSEQISHYVLKTVLLVGAFLIAENYDSREIFDEIEKTLYFFTICALILYAFKLVLPSLVERLPVVVSTANARFNTIYVATISQTKYVLSGFYRIQGIFREPGVYAIYLFIALWHELFILTNLRFKRIVVYLAAVLLTFSTTAYVTIFILFIAFMLDKNKVNNKKVKNLILILFIAAVSYLLLFTNILSADGFIFSKLNSTSDTYASGIARFASIYVNLYEFIRHPLFGYGIYHLNDHFSNLAIQLYGHFTGDNTNSFLMGLAAHGAIFGGIIIYGWFRFIWKQPQRKSAAVFLILAAVVATSCEYLLNNLMFYLFAFMGIRQAYTLAKNDIRKSNYDIAPSTLNKI